eukprot:sb/3469736/
MGENNLNNLYSPVLSVSKHLFFYLSCLVCVQSDPDLPGPDLPEPRFTGRINFPRYRNLMVFHPDIPGTPIYRAKSFPPRIPVNRGPTVLGSCFVCLLVVTFCLQSQSTVLSVSKHLFFYLSCLVCVQSDPDLPGPDLPEPRFTGRINFPRYRNLMVFHPDIPGTPIYRAKSFPPRIPVNRGPTVLGSCFVCLLVVTFCLQSQSTGYKHTDRGDNDQVSVRRF